MYYWGRGEFSKKDGQAAHRTGIRRRDLGGRVQVNESSHNLYDNMLFYWNTNILSFLINSLRTH